MADDNAASSAAVAEPEFAYPPPLGGLKRYGLLALLLLIALTAIRLWWGHEAQRRIDAIINAAHARGERILPGDFQTEALPDSDNAAILLNQAGVQIRFTREQDDWENGFRDELPLSVADRRVITALLSANRGAIDLARQARSRTRADYGIRIRTPVMATLLPYLNPARQLATLLKYDALYQHDAGNDAQAIELARDIARQERAIEQSTPFLITHLVSAGIASVNSDLLLWISPDLRVAVANDSRGPAASPKQVAALIGELLDEASTDQSLRRAMQAERMMYIDFAPMFASPSLPAPLRDFFLPMFQLDAARQAQRIIVPAAAPRRHEYFALMAAMPVPPPRDGESLLQQTTEMLGDEFGAYSSGRVRPASPYQSALMRHFRVLADRRAAAIFLALRWYAVEHDGRLPGTVSDLVPAYLTSLPADPFAADGRPLRYRPDTRPPIVYSVGENGRDDNASTQPVDSRCWSPRIRYDRLDWVYPFAPRASASTQPSSN